MPGDAQNYVLDQTLSPKRLRKNLVDKDKIDLCYVPLNLQHFHLLQVGWCNMVDLYVAQGPGWCMLGYSDPLSISQQNFLYEMEVNADWKLYRLKSFT